MFSILLHKLTHLTTKRLKLIFATGNPHKLQELQVGMPYGIELITPRDCGIMEDIPENESTIEGNASAKAWHIYRLTGRNCFADDTGLEVLELGGEPGVHSARYAADNGYGKGHSSEDNMAFLLKKMEPIENRKARFRTVISLILEGQEHLFEGIIEGEICREPSGEGGFGYDPIFRAVGHQKTFAELSLQEKNLISHRGLATAKLVRFLNANFAV